ncbi:unnamed protein product [Rotaria sp. Silwood2]|nr:unnamed protein product [Rotaria sp. Silwood2]CAF3081092.1 unnamed protein product [Rotaria sp. Silwood2]CAF3937682.1 unnamed protein product [Rotaria sp. Silwood2]CAF4062973.1 unnamed protein product [Rotaria sp. Silwood2]
MFSVLLITWLLVFNQQIVAKTVGLNVEYVEDDLDEEILATTEHSIPTENTTDNDHSYYNTIIVENETSTDSNDQNNMNKVESSLDDVIELNVGGQRITTFRSTLTVIPNSKLARMFTKDNRDRTKSKSKENNAYFLDYNPVQFAYLLDQLRAIKRMSNFSPHELDIKEPNADIRFNFSNMLNELGLNPERFLSPFVGIHLNLKTDSLVGWKECYRGKYDTSFNATILTDTCKGKRLLVACRSVNNNKILTVAGVGDRENIFNSCPSNNHCTPNKKNGIGFYYVADNVWGFEGRPKNWVDTNYYGYYVHTSFLSNCDSSDYYSEYRLCWSLSSGAGRGGGDRCGSAKYLQNSKEWERIIYQTI